MAAVGMRVVVAGPLRLHREMCRFLAPLARCPSSHRSDPTPAVLAPWIG